MDDDGQEPPLPLLLGPRLPPVKSLSQVKRRLRETAVAIDEDDPGRIVYQHTIICQTCLPYKDPGDGVREWRRRQGYSRVEGRRRRSLPGRNGRVGEGRAAVRFQAAAHSRAPERGSHSYPVAVD